MRISRTKILPGLIVMWVLAFVVYYGMPPLEDMLMQGEHWLFDYLTWQNGAVDNWGYRILWAIGDLSEGTVHKALFASVGVVLGGWIAHVLWKKGSSNMGCPVCANRALIPGENDLAATHPDLARQWHPTKNGVLTPHDVVAGAHRKVWWRCEKGHEWRSLVSSRAQSGAGCPVCAGKVIIPGENDLHTLFPSIAAQWYREKNGPLTPETVSPYSIRKVWWRCDMGHPYQAVIGARTMHGSGCPYCANRKVLPGFNDLATMEPKIAAQWHPTLNGSLTPEQVTAGSHRKVWWQCPDGHIWKAVIYSRAGPQKTGCPVCAGRIQPARVERYRRMAAEREQERLWDTLSHRAENKSLGGTSK